MTTNTLRKEKNLDQALEQSFPASDPLPITPKPSPTMYEGRDQVRARMDRLTKGISSFEKKIERVLDSPNSQATSELLSVLDKQLVQLNASAEFVSSL